MLEEVKSSIDVIIPTKNRVKDLVKLLELLLRQETKPERIIVVDDGDYDYLQKELHTRRIIKRSTEQGIEIIHVKGLNKGLTGARNLSLKYSNSNVVVFLDDDVLIPLNFLEIIQNIFKLNKDLVALTGHIINVSSTNRRYKILWPLALKKSLINPILKILQLQHFEIDSSGLTKALYPFYPYPIIRDKLIRTKMLPGAFFSVKKGILIKYNIVFDENLKLLNSPLEDIDFSIKVSKMPTYVHSSLLVFHKKRPSKEERSTIIISATYRLFLISKHYGSILMILMFFISLFAKYLLQSLNPYNRVERKTSLYYLYSLLWILKNLRLFLKCDIKAINERLEKILRG